MMSESPDWFSLRVLFVWEKASQVMCSSSLSGPLPQSTCLSMQGVWLGHQVFALGRLDLLNSLTTVLLLP
jgi:hypothetical protein